VAYVHFIIKTSEAHASEVLSLVLSLRVGHLLDTLLLGLALGGFRCQQVELSLLRRADNQFKELLVVPNRIVDEREIG
jgi:hypothetical protein